MAAVGDSSRNQPAAEHFQYLIDINVSSSVIRPLRLLPHPDRASRAVLLVPLRVRATVDSFVPACARCACFSVVSACRTQRPFQTACLSCVPGFD